MVAAGLLPVAMEIMDELAIEAAQSSVKPGLPDVPALLIVELDGERACVDEDVARLREVIRASGATEVRATEDAAERALIWKGRKSAFSAVGWLAPDYLVQDGCVPRTRLGEALEEIGRMAARAGLRVANVFHAGDGNLHPLILFDGREPGAVERAEALAGEILDLCVAPRRLDHRRARHRRREARLPAAHVRRRRRSPRCAASRRAVDPLELANRGKMFPPARRPAARRRRRRRRQCARSQDAVREHPRVLPRGGGTKPALSTPPEGVVPLVVSGLRGIVEYDPDGADDHRAGGHAGARRAGGARRARAAPAVRPAAGARRGDARRRGRRGHVAGPAATATAACATSSSARASSTAPARWSAAAAAWSRTPPASTCRG